MDLSTRRRVFSEQGDLLITRETVAVDTPACKATSAIVDLALVIVVPAYQLPNSLFGLF
jgi:hypothetical protein